MSDSFSKPSLSFWRQLSVLTTRYRIGLDCCVLLAVVLLVFWPSLYYGYYSEDFDFALHHAMRPIAKFNELFLPKPLKLSDDTPAFYRPLGFLAWRIAGLFGGTNPIAQHALSLVVHSINTLLVYALFRSIRGLDHKTAWFGAALFAIFPSHSEAIVWSAAHFDQLALCFSLLTILTAIKIRNDLLAALLSSGMYLLALCSKEAAIVASALLVLWLIIQWLNTPNRQTFGRFIAQHCWRLVALGALSIGYLLWRIYLFGDLGGYRQEGVPLHERQSLSDLIEHGKGLLYFALLPLDWPGLLRHSSAIGLVQWLVALLVTSLIVWIALCINQQDKTVGQVIIHPLAFFRLLRLGFSPKRRSLARPPTATNIPPNKQGLYLRVPIDFPKTDNSIGFRISLLNFVLGLGWIIIAIMPALSLVNSWYWLVSSRFFYIGSVGSALLLALGLSWLLNHNNPLLQRAAYGAACGLILLSCAGLLGVNQRWQAASHEIQAILDDLHKAVPEPGLHATFLLPKLPDNHNSVFMFRNGTNAAIQLSYNNPSIQVVPLNSEKPANVARPDRVYAFMMNEGQLIPHPEQDYFSGLYARLGYTPGLPEVDWQGEFGPLEHNEFHQWRWLKEQGCLVLRSEREQVIDLKMILWTPKPQHELTIALQGSRLAQLPVGPEPQELQLASIALQAGEQCLLFQADRAQSIDQSLQNGDQRVVSVAVADVIIELATRLSAPYQPEHPLEVELDGQIAFLGYDIYRADGALRPGQQFTLQTYWKVLQTLKHDLRLQIQLFDRQGQLLYQLERSVVDDHLPPSQWNVGELLRGLTTVSLPEDLPVGPYSVQLQLFDPVSQKVLTLTNAPEQHARSGILLGSW
jgi:hypothetical protein